MYAFVGSRPPRLLEKISHPITTSRHCAWTLRTCALLHTFQQLGGVFLNLLRGINLYYVLESNCLELEFIGVTKYNFFFSPWNTDV